MKIVNYIIFFTVILFTLMYLVTFWNNRGKKIKFTVFNHEIEINLGLLAFSIFLDGVIIALLINWLLK